MTDLKSQLGFSVGSPYRNNPYLKINTPDGKITMDNTDIPLFAHDELGNAKYMAPYSGEHTFPGKQVYEYRTDKIMKQGGSNLHGGDNGLNVGIGNPYINQTYYQQGGSIKDLYNYLFKEDDEDKPDDTPVTAPSTSEVQSAQEEQQEEQQLDENTQMLMQMGLGQNPYSGSTTPMQQGSSNGFKTYKTYQEGKQALLDQLNLYKTGRTRNNVSPDSTLQQAMSVYAPVGDGKNNPTLYAAYIAHSIGVTPNTPISKISTVDWANAIEKFEGNRHGNNPGNLRGSH